MVSERKRQANRANAQKSTGPRSAEGKKRVSQNRITHGLLSQNHPLLPHEDALEYRAMADAIERDLAPVGMMQRDLVTQIIQINWKLRRIPAIEAALVQYDALQCAKRHARLKRKGKIDENAPLPEPTAAILIAAHFAHNSNVFERLEQHQLRLLRAQFAALRQLEKLRSQTKGEEIHEMHQLNYELEETFRMEQMEREQKESYEKTVQRYKATESGKCNPNNEKCEFDDAPKAASERSADSAQETPELPDHEKPVYPPGDAISASFSPAPSHKMVESRPGYSEKDRAGA